MDSPLKILLIEDDEVDRMMVRRALSASGVGAEFEEASDAASGIRAAQAQAFDCILLDYRLPDADGLSTLREIRAAGVNTPVILLTGQGDEQVAVEMMKAGANDYLSKTRLSRDLLSHAVRHLVRLHRAQAEMDLAQAQTLESEERFQRMANSAPVLLWVTEENGHCTYVNQVWLHFTGRTMAECMGRGWQRDVHPDDLSATEETCARAYRENRPFEVEYRLRRHDGQYRWMLSSASPRMLSGGRCAGFVGSCTDITDRKQAEQDRAELLDREQQARAAAEALNRIGTRLAAELDVHKLVQTVTDEATALTRAEFGSFFYNVTDDKGESYTLFTLSGVPREKFEQFPMPRNTEVFGPTFRGEGIVRLDDVTKDPRFGKNPPYHGMPPGHLPVRSYLAAPVVSRSGAVLGGLFFGHSEVGRFSERDERLLQGIAAQAAIAIDNAQLYEALRASEQQYRFLAESIPQLVWTSLADGRCDYVNRRYLEYTGLSEQQLLDHAWVEALYPDDRERARAAWQSALESGDRYDVEFRLRRHDGIYRWFRTRGLPGKDADGRIVKWFGTCTDIDEQKRAQQELHEAKEAAEAANAAKDQFLAVLSHELRTPLTPVLSVVQALESEPALPPEMRGGLDMVRRNVELEARLIDDLLDLTRIARGKLELNVQVTDAHEAMRNAIEICNDELRGKGLDLKVELNATRHHVRADAARLQQVFWNLLKNSVKFTPEGGRITVRTDNEPAGHLRVEVRDTGIGIDPHVLPRIFDAFEQGERSITRQFGGLGLGLAISKALIDMQGGTLTADSAGRDRGSIFVVEMATAAAPAAASRPSPTNGQSPHRDLHILVVDDHEDTARAMRRLLERLGYRITIAGSVLSALDTFDRHPFDLVISDIGLPDGSGLDLMRQLLRRKPVPGIALSGFGMEEDIRKSKEAGFREHLTKPVNLQKLHATIRQVSATA